MATAKVGYVDGFVFPVPKKNIPAYKKMASEASRVWKKFGALQYYECVGDDLHIKGMGGMPPPRSFVKLVKPKSGETIWFSYIGFKSKTHRNQVNKKVMAYFSKKYAKVKEKDMIMPFDTRKMCYGGFKVEVGA